MHQNLWQALATLVGEALAKRWLASHANTPPQLATNDGDNKPTTMQSEGLLNVATPTSQEAVTRK